jgi:hypothetical protein
MSLTKIFTFDLSPVISILFFKLGQYFYGSWVVFKKLLSIISYIIMEVSFICGGDNFYLENHQPVASN